MLGHPGTWEASRDLKLRIRYVRVATPFAGFVVQLVSTQQSCCRSLKKEWDPPKCGAGCRIVTGCLRAKILMT